MDEEKYFIAEEGAKMSLAQCDGCGFITNRPTNYRSLIREAFKIACCPEMRFRRFEAVALEGLQETV